MKKIILILTLIFATFASFSQNFLLAKSIGGIRYDGAVSIAVDGKGNMLITGYYSDTVDFDPSNKVYNLISKGNTDIFVLKLNATGEFKWAKSMGGINFDEVKSIATDNEGNSYITGIFESKSDFDPSSDTAYLNSNGIFDIFICKLDSNGGFDWAKNVGGIQSDEGRSIQLDSTGSIYVTGGFIGTVDFDPGPKSLNITSASSSPGLYDIFILKLDNDGNLLWAHGLGGKTNDYGYSLGIDLFDNIYIGGNYTGKFDFNPGPSTFNLTSSLNGSMFLLKLSSQGNFIWAKSIDATVRSISVDVSGNSYLTGVFNGTVDFNPGSGVYNMSSIVNSMFLVRINTKGNFEWAKRINAEAYSVGVDLYGNIYSAGGFGGKVDFNTGLDSTYLSSSGVYDVFLLKMDSSANFLWAVNMQGTKGGDGAAFSVVCDKKGNPHTAGVFTDTVDFNPAVDKFKLISKKYYDAFISKLLPCTTEPIYSEKISGSNDICEGSVSIFSINPIKNATGYKWSVPNDAIILNGQNSNSIEVRFGTKSGNITLTPFNSCGNANSDTIKVIINPTPKINVQPADKKVISGSKAIFFVSLSGKPDIIQWQQNSGGNFVNLINSGQFSGVKSDTLVISNVSISQNNYLYRCIFSNGSCTDTSNSAILSIETGKIAQQNIVDNISFYPNPTTGVIQIHVSNNFLGKPFYINDISGRVILSGLLDSRMKLLELSLLASGAYFIEFGDINKKTLKLIKN